MGLVLGRCKPDFPETQSSTDQQSEPERQVLLGLARRWLLAAPLLALICALLWGLNGLWSSLLALGLVLVNFVLGAAAITFGARISTRAIGPSVLLGYLFRMGLMVAVVLPVLRDEWFEAVPFAIVLLVTHIGLLLWETRRVSATLAYPGLKPSKANRSNSGQREPAKPASASAGD